MADNGSLFLQGAGVGGNLYSSGVENALRIQQLQSARAMQQFKERQAAAETELLMQNVERATQQNAVERQQQAQLQSAADAIQMKINARDPVGVPIWDEDEAVAQHLVPIAINNPRAANALDSYLKVRSYQKAQEGKALLEGLQAQKLRQEIDSGGFQPNIETITNPRTGEPVDVFRSSKNAAQLLEGKPKSDEIGEEYNRYLQAKGKGDENLAKIRLGHLNKMAESSGTQVKVNPDGTIEFTQGPLKETEKEANAIGGAQAVLTQGNALLKDLQPHMVGIRGLANRLETSVGGQIPGFKVPQEAIDATEAETMINQFNSLVQKSLKPDSNMDRMQVKLILDSLPKTGAISSVDQAKTAIRSTLRNIGITARTGAQAKGHPIPKEFLKPSEIRAKLAAKELTEQEALDLLKVTPFGLGE